jgi:nitroreductase
MTSEEAIRARHSVRQFLPQPLSPRQVEALTQAVEACRRESGLHIQLVLDEPEAFSGPIARYGRFRGVTHYLALAGPQSAHLEEACGYQGEKLVLLAQQMGLNTCWVGLTYSKGKVRCSIDPGEKLVCLIALGHGATQGSPRRSKTPDQVSQSHCPAPSWFRRGVEAALLAPTALNRQRFRLTLQADGVRAQAGRGPWAKLDLGIVKYHFEVGAGKENVRWV